MVIHFSYVRDGVPQCATLARLAVVSLILTDQRRTTKQQNRSVGGRGSCARDVQLVYECGTSNASQ